LEGVGAETGGIGFADAEAPLNNESSSDWFNNPDEEPVGREDGGNGDEDGGGGEDGGGEDGETPNNASNSS
jgi:hypothetical protein